VVSAENAGPEQPNVRLNRPRGLLEPCAATSGKHGSEEGGAGKRHPLSDSLHWLRDTLYREDNSTVHTRSGPRIMAALRNLAIGAIRLTGRQDISESTRWATRAMQRPFTILKLI
jgi:hypothetical protein